MGTLYSATEGLLDWFEIDKGFTELPFIQIDLCVLCVFVLYSCVSLSSCPFLDILVSSSESRRGGVVAGMRLSEDETRMPSSHPLPSHERRRKIHELSLHVQSNFLRSWLGRDFLRRDS